MTQNPILKVLLIFQRFGVKNLLIGGQACIIYGAAEFSRDSDFVVLCNSRNLNRVTKALRALKAQNIYFPPLKKEFLDKGHACHFRCYADSVRGLRVDIIAKLRGCEGFENLWKRRFRVKIGGNNLQVIGLQDLVRSKKTQRDKDWLMLSRLVETDMIVTQRPSRKKVAWWLLECRSPEKLIALTRKNKKLVKRYLAKRTLLKTSLAGDIKKLQQQLSKEEQLEREEDKKYWGPLRKELEMLRHKVTLRNS